MNHTQRQASPKSDRNAQQLFAAATGIALHFSQELARPGKKSALPTSKPMVDPTKDGYPPRDKKKNNIGSVN